jgi:threonine/homoserine/homoserine lactone efflux protein
MSLYWADFLKIALAHWLAMASPGPDFAIVLKQSLRSGRKTGVWTAWGVASAICLHITYSLFGLGLLLRSSPAVFMAVKFAGAGYLGWIGVKALRAKPGVECETLPRSATFEPCFGWGAWRVGFFTNALNPKVTLFFVAIFAALVRPGTPLGVRLFYGGWISLTTGLWFTLVAFVFARESVRRRFLRYGFWIDRAMGAVFLIFAALLALATIG